jgi:hypothetical protein
MLPMRDREGAHSKMALRSRDQSGTSAETMFDCTSPSNPESIPLLNPGIDDDYSYTLTNLLACRAFRLMGRSLPSECLAQPYVTCALYLMCFANFTNLPTGAHGIRLPGLSLIQFDEVSKRHRKRH